MSAEYLTQMKQRFNDAYTPLIAGSVAVKQAALPNLYNMKVEFDAAMALVRDTVAETEWVRSVLAEHGYSGPLTEAACPLREWLAPPQTDKVPEKFTEYAIDHEWRGRITHFGGQSAIDRMAEFVVAGEKFTFSTTEYVFADEWKFACSMLKQGQPLSPPSLHALKLGVEAGMVPEL
jgi:hypothetical protein